MLHRCLLFIALAAVWIAGARLVIPDPACADDKRVKLRRVEEYTYKPEGHTLDIIVGESECCDYKPQRFHAYTMNFDAATMRYLNDTRYFSHEEAERVTALLELIHQYGVDSIRWLEAGMGKEPPVEDQKPKAE